jgi:uncharacterized membrane protein YjjP (DUF1212 family)
MDLFTIMFWIGFLILLGAHIQMLRQHVQTATRRHATIALTGLALMFIGSKIGREFLGIK